MWIYALVSGELILYVGQTKSIERRMREHKNKKTGTGSTDIPAYIDWDLRILEKVLQDEKVVRERYWYDVLKPLYNKIRPGESPCKKKMK